MPNITVPAAATGLPATILLCPVAAHADRLAWLYEHDEWSPEIGEIERAIQQGQASSLEGLLLQALFIVDYDDCAASMPPLGAWQEAHRSHTSAIGSIALNMVSALVAMGARLPERIMSQHGFDQEGRDAVGSRAFRDPVGDEPCCGMRTILFLGSIE